MPSSVGELSDFLHTEKGNAIKMNIRIREVYYDIEHSESDTATNAIL